jgi:hypothetical protein
MRVSLLVIALVLPVGATAGEGTIKITLDVRWAGVAPDGTEVAYDFSSDGSVIWRDRLGPSPGRSVGRRLRAGRNP